MGSPPAALVLFVSNSYAEFQFRIPDQPEADPKVKTIFRRQ